MEWYNVAAMHIQLSQSMFAALSASQRGYIMRQRGELEIKVRRSSRRISK